MSGPVAPKDPEKDRSYFYIMKEKETFGSLQTQVKIIRLATMDFSIEPRSREQRLQRRIIRHLTHVLIPIFHSMTEPVMTV